MNIRLFSGINKTGDVEKVDADSFRFHGTMKAIFYKLVKLINPPPKEWVDDIPGNIGVLRDIYREYEAHEKQAWRRDVLTRVLPFGLCLSEYDSNYEEVVQWFLYRIIQEQDRFKFTKQHKDPERWFQDERGYRIGLTNENRATVRRIRSGDDGEQPEPNAH